MFCSSKAFGVPSPSDTAFIINTLPRISSYISIQGVIGAGKSTFMDRLDHHIKSSGTCAITCTDFTHSDYYLLVDEPVDEWTSVKCSTRTFTEEREAIEEQHSILDIFYSDKRRWALPFQLYAFTSRIRRIIGALKQINPRIPTTAHIHIIAERSLRTDYLFFRNLYESGDVVELEWFTYAYFFDLFCSEIMSRETHMIYINTEPRRCFDRVKRRAREAETNHTTTPEQDTEFFEYLVSLDSHHKRMIEAFRREKGDDRVFVINGDEEITSHEKWDMIVADFRVAITV